MRALRLEELPWEKFDSKKRRVFCRVDFNVPIQKGQILDDYRIRQSLPTIRALLEKQAIVVLGSHLGRPQKLSEGERKQKLSLLPVAEKLAELLGEEIWFSEESTGSGVRRLVQDAKPGKNVILLENLRFYPGEEQNEAVFAEKLFENCDIYINDAFGACHRAHASIHRVAERTICRAMGNLLAKEYEVLTDVLHSPQEPQAAILGGAKIEDKILVIEQLLKTCRKVFVGGRMGLSFLAAKGYETGATQFDEAAIQTAKRLLAQAKAKKVEFFFPVDGRLGRSLEDTDSQVLPLGEGRRVPGDLMILDIGPKTLAAWTRELESMKSVIWNGPMGVFENPVFAEGTLGLVDVLVERRESLQSVAGGGETVAAITQRGALEQLHHVSTGGGAMLEFLEGKNLPGLEVLKLREREISEIAGRLAS